MSALLDRQRAENGRKPLGRKVNPRRARYMKKFGISTEKRVRSLTMKFMDQLDACASDCARRLLLGLSEKFAAKVPVSASAAVRVAA